MSTARSRSGGSAIVDRVDAVEQVVAEAARRATRRSRSRLRRRRRARTSTSTFCVPPTRKKLPCSSARSSFACSLGVSSPISSRKSVPSAASSIRPALRVVRAAERAALVAEQLDSRARPRRATAQSTSTNGPTRPDRRWIARATSVLARARLAGDEHRRIARRDALDQRRARRCIGAYCVIDLRRAVDARQPRLEIARSRARAGASPTRAARARRSRPCDTASPCSRTRRASSR